MRFQFITFQILGVMEIERGIELLLHKEVATLSVQKLLNKDHFPEIELCYGIH